MKRLVDCFYKWGLLALVACLPFSLTAQNTSCANADPFCTDSGVSFPANSDGTGVGNGPQASTIDPGNNYGCLGTTGNPAWFYLEIDNPGNIDITLSNTNNIDIDFALWGPFPSLAAALGTCGSLGAPTDCSYLTDATEFVNVPNSTTGQVYLMLITNYNNNPTDIIGNQTGGTGSTNCGIIPPCAPDAGTVTTGTSGTGTGTNTLTLCVGDNFTLTSNDDYVLPPNLPGEVSELMYAVYNCAPPASPDPEVDACFSGLFWTGEDVAGGDPGATNTSGGIPPDLTGAGITGTGGTTIWYIPVTVDDSDNNGNPNGVINVDQNGDDCYDVGAPIQITYLQNVTSTTTTSCTPSTGTGSITYTFEGGAPAAGMGVFTVNNAGPGTFSSGTVSNGGTVTLNNLNDGDNVSFTLTDANGCTYGPYTVTFSCGDDACLINSTLTANPPPGDFPNNQYPPGTVVEFCFSVDQYNQTNVNFLHGIVPSYSGAWDGPAIPTVNPNVAANNEQGSYWDWLPGGSVGYNTTNTSIMDDGWWFFSVNSPGGIPTFTDNSWGDGCTAECFTGTDQATCVGAGGAWVPGCGCTNVVVGGYADATACFNAGGGVWLGGGNCDFRGCVGNSETGSGLTWTACFTLTATVDCGPEETMLVSVKTYADGETGIWTDPGCTVDQPVVFDGLSICCLDPPTGGPFTFCADEDFTLTAVLNPNNDPGGGATPGVNTINWYDVPTGGIALETGSLTYNPPYLAPGSYTYYVEESDNGCLSARTPVNLTVLAPPYVTFQSVDQNICLGETITITADVQNGTITGWTGEGTSGTGASQTVTPTASQTYTVSVSSVNGCDPVTMPIPITVNDVPILSTPTTNFTICPGDSFDLSAIPVNDAVAWSPGDTTITYYEDGGPPILLNDPVVTPTTSTTYQIVSTIASGECSDILYINVDISDFQVDPGQPLTLCEGSTIYLGAYATDAAGAITYEWSNGLGPGRTQTDIMGTVSTTYTVTATDNGTGCTVTGEVTIKPATNAAPTITCPADITQNNDATVCEALVSLPEVAVTTGDDCPPPSITAANGITLNYYGSYNGSFYYISDTPINPTNTGTASEPDAFAAAQAAAAEFGGNIVTIDDDAENDFVTYAGLGYGTLMIGYTDELVEGSFGWIGPGSAYTNWAGGEPNNVGNEDYVELGANGEWNDFSMLTVDRYVIVELPTMPVGVTIGCDYTTDVFPVGTTAVSCTVTDWNGLSATCSYNVTVVDNEPPNAICQDITIQLNAAGSATAIATDVDNGSTDNCAIDTYVLSQTAFDCSHLGANSVTLTVTDIYGNSSSCIATVTVVDNIDPIAICLDYTTYLDAAGNATITVGDINGGVTDNCSAVATATPLSFTCANVGANTVTLTATDPSGNTGTCPATVTVLDTISPVAVCTDFTVTLDNTGNASISAGDIDNGSSDNCGIAGLSVSPSTFDCSTLGANTVTLTVTDVNGNTSTCTATVTVLGTLSAIASPDATLCVGHTAYLGAWGMDGAPGYTYTWDNGLGAGRDQTVVVAGAVPITYTVTVTDAGGCTATAQTTVTPIPDNPPTITCPADVSVNNDAGVCEANVTLPATTATDDCPPAMLTGSNGVPLLYAGMYNGSYYYVTGVNMTPAEIAGASTEPEAFAAVQAAAAEYGGYIATVDDAAENDYITQVGTHFGNLVIGYTDEQVEGSFGWVGSCCGGGGSGYTNWNGGEPNNAGNEDYVEVQVSSGGGWNDITLSLSIREAVIEFPAMPQDVTVACDQSTGVFPVGTTTVTCTATDWAGQTASCSYDVTVTDNEPPVASCQDVTIDFAELGVTAVTLTPTDIDAGSTDNCAIASMTVSPDTFDCDDAGTTPTVTLTVTDVNGNSSTCTATVTILEIPVGFKR